MTVSELFPKDKQQYSDIQIEKIDWPISISIHYPDLRN